MASKTNFLHWRLRRQAPSADRSGGRGGAARREEVRDSCGAKRSRGGGGVVSTPSIPRQRAIVRRKAGMSVTAQTEWRGTQAHRGFAL